MTPPVLKPFPIDPEVMEHIRPMQLRDVSRVASLHQAAMGNSLWARLGLPFLVTLYKALLEDPEFLAFVYEENHRVRGFIAGSTDSRALYTAVLAQHRHALILPALQGILRSPTVIGPLLFTSHYFQRSAPPAEEIPAESMFCSFEPELRGKRVSGHINKVLFDELRARGHRKVKITSEVDNEGAFRQLSSWGFEQVGRFTFYGKEMVVWVLDLEACERVEPVSRHPGPMRRR